VCRANNLTLSRSDYFEIWKPQPPGNLRDYPGLYTDCFTFYYINDLSFFLSYSDLCLPTHCRCLRLLLHLITIGRIPLDERSAHCKKISPLQKPLIDNMQHSQFTNNHAPGGNETPNPSKQAAADHAQDRMATICYSIHICFITQCVPKQCKKY